MINNKYYYGTGKRKSSSSRVFMKIGNGNIIINNKNINDIKSNIIKNIILIPLIITKLDNNVDLFITVKGGGFSSQSNAIKHGISIAIVNYNKDYKTKLKKIGCLTRDSRCVERKKFGYKKSRKKAQYSKR